MDRGSLMVLVLFALSLTASTTAWTAPSKDEKNLEKEISRIDRTAAAPDGEKAVVRRIRTDFKVADADIQSLRSGNLGYGEIVTIYSLARQMPGGITEANVRRITALRQGPPAAGWGQIARQVNAKLRMAVSQSKKLNDEAHREMKRDQAASGRSPGKAGQGSRGNGGAHPPQSGQQR